MIFAICFCLLGRGNQCTFKIGMFININIITFITSINSSLFIDAGVVGIDFRFIETASNGCAITHRHTPTHVHLFAFVRGGVLQAFDVEVLGIDFYTFAFHLATDEVHITTCMNHCFTLTITYMACNISGFITIAVTFSGITA